MHNLQFDYIAANPPYVSVKDHNQAFSVSTNTQVKKIWQQDLGTTDMMPLLHEYFMVFSLKHLKKAGSMCMITPCSWVSSPILCSYLLNNAHVKSMFKFNKRIIFPNVQTDSMISIMRHKSPDNAVTLFFELLQPTQTLQHYVDMYSKAYESYKGNDTSVIANFATLSKTLIATCDNAGQKCAIKYNQIDTATGFVKLAFAINAEEALQLCDEFVTINKHTAAKYFSVSKGYVTGGDFISVFAHSTVQQFFAGHAPNVLNEVLFKRIQNRVVCRYIHDTNEDLYICTASKDYMKNHLSKFPKEHPFRVYWTQVPKFFDMTVEQWNEVADDENETPIRKYLAQQFLKRFAKGSTLIKEKSVETTKKRFVTKGNFAHTSANAKTIIELLKSNMKYIVTGAHIGFNDARRHRYCRFALVDNTMAKPMWMPNDSNFLLVPLKANSTYELVIAMTWLNSLPFEIIYRNKNPTVRFDDPNNVILRLTIDSINNFPFPDLKALSPSIRSYVIDLGVKMFELVACCSYYDAVFGNSKANLLAMFTRIPSAEYLQQCYAKKNNIALMDNELDPLCEPRALIQFQQQRGIADPVAAIITRVRELFAQIMLLQFEIDQFWYSFVGFNDKVQEAFEQHMYKHADFSLATPLEIQDLLQNALLCRSDPYLMRGMPRGCYVNQLVVDILHFLASCTTNEECKYYASITRLYTQALGIECNVPATIEDSKKDVLSCQGAVIHFPCVLDDLRQVLSSSAVLLSLQQFTSCSNAHQVQNWSVVDVQQLCAKLGSNIQVHYEDANMHNVLSFELFGHIGMAKWLEEMSTKWVESVDVGNSYNSTAQDVCINLCINLFLVATVA